MSLRQNQKLIQALERSLLCNVLLIDAMFELLAERGILSGEEVLARIKGYRLEPPVPKHSRPN